MARLARTGAHEVGDQEADLGRGEELACALAGTLRELAEQVLVGAAQEVGLHVGEAESVARVGKGLDHGGELGGVDVALAVAFGGEVDQVDHAGEGRVVPDDGPDRLREVLADVARAGAAALVVERPLMGYSAVDAPPTCFRGEVEAQQLVIVLGDLPRCLRVAVLLGQPVDLVVEHVREALEEEEGQEVVLELGGVLLAPDGAGGVPQHLLHGLGGRLARAPRAPAARDLRGSLGRFGFEPIDVDVRFGGERGDCGARRLLRNIEGALPAVDAGEGDAEPVRELFLREVETASDGTQNARVVLTFCHICSMTYTEWLVKEEEPVDIGDVPAPLVRLSFNCSPKQERRSVHW